jgi:signal transduction histidine kinase
MREVIPARAVSELVTLARYQIPPQIRIEQAIDDRLVCQLPDVLLRQALLNLLLNASEALGDSPGTITITAAVVDGVLRLEVCDDGPGFPAALFETGIRAFDTHRPGGTGLGLSMVQRFARACGGTLTLANRAPHGARVTLELPCGRKEHV